MRHFSSVFSLEDLQREYKGVKTYTFMQYAYMERKKGLLFLPRYHFLYIDRLAISPEVKNEYFTFLTALFSEFHVELLTANKVFNILKLRRPDILVDLKIADDSYTLFSLTEQLFSGKLYFRRPYFCLNDNAHDDHLLDFIYAHEKFSKNDIINYSTRTGVKIINYLQLVVKCYDDYVQIDKLSFVRKDVFLITDEQLEAIKKYLLYKTRNGALSVLNNNDYSLLPKINYQYNPYLLAGIARTLLSDDFVVSNTHNEYFITDYLITKK